MTLSLKIATTERSADLFAGSLTLQLNTLDFAVVNVTGVGGGGNDIPSAALGLTVVLSDPAKGLSWTGTIVAAEIRPATSRTLGTTHYISVMTATNTTAGTVRPAPFDLSDAPTNATTHFLLEDGSGHLILEEVIGDYLTEGALSYAYRNLNVRYQQNTDATTGQVGTCEVLTPGLWPGMSFKLTCSDISISAITYLISRVSVTYPGEQTANAPVWAIEFGLTAPKLFKAWLAAGAP